MKKQVQVSQMHKSKDDFNKSKLRFLDVMGRGQHQATLKRQSTKAHEITIREWYSKHQQSGQYSFQHVHDELTMICQPRELRSMRERGEDEN